MSKNKNKYAHAFLCIKDIGSETLKALALHFGDLEKAWVSSDSEISSLSDIRSDKKEQIVSNRKKIDVEKEWADFLTTDTLLLTLDDETYPALLREIPDAPYTLYIRGNFDWTRKIPMMAIVGSRKYTKYGEQAAYQLAQDLTHAGFLVVSGLAFGIDSIAHKGALEAHGETIAVMGNGTAEQSLYPRNHVPLAHRIMEHGAVISEYHPNTVAAPWTFPLRNRIVAGMTLGTIVVEAAEDSGSLITASLALQYNREVFAVPGSIFSPASVGTNGLLKRGAKMVTGVQDILEEFSHELLQVHPVKNEKGAVPLGLSSEEELILHLLTHEPLHIDKIIKATTLQTAHANSILALLEIKGLAKDIGGMHYIRMQ